MAKTFRQGLEHENPVMTAVFVKKILFWFLINTVLGTIIASFIATGSPYPYMDIFISSQVTTHIISMLSSITGYILGRRFVNKNILKQILLVIPWTFAASLAGYSISQLISRYIIKISIFPATVGHSPRLLVPILFITLVITAISITIEHLSRSRRGLLEIIEKEKQAGKNESTLTIKEKDNYFVIDLNKIIYLSSHGKKTLIHTEDRDYETPQLLKEIEKKLSAKIFIRIHKQFIVNINFILKIQYYEGGRYMAYLKDEDESMLPVSKNATILLKERLRI